MIIRQRPSLLKLFFIIRGSVVPRIAAPLLVVISIAVMVVAGRHAAPALVPSISSTPFALFGLALSIFLGFRNSACYDRWWEARKDWGLLVHASRNLARQTLMLEGREGGTALRRELLDLTIVFVHALRQHLRPGGEVERGLDRLPAENAAALEASRNGPDFVLRLLGKKLAEARNSNLVSDVEYRLLDDGASQMALVLAACERIRSTPVPFAYTLLLHRTAYIFCLLLPFGFVDALGWLTPFASAVVAYAFFGLDALGDELETPFGRGHNSLPLAAMALTIEINLREAMGETDLPPLPQPVDHVLM